MGPETGARGVTVLMSAAVALNLGCFLVAYITAMGLTAILSAEKQTIELPSRCFSRLAISIHARESLPHVEGEDRLQRGQILTANPGMKGQ